MSRSDCLQREIIFKIFKEWDVKFVEDYNIFLFKMEFSINQYYTFIKLLRQEM